MKVTTATPKELIAMMEKNQLDLIYFLDRPRYNNNWNKELEVREPIVFVTSPESPLASRKGLRLVEILDEPFFLTEKQGSFLPALFCGAGECARGAAGGAGCDRFWGCHVPPDLLS